MAIIDTGVTKATEKGGSSEPIGYDAGKKINGIRRLFAHLTERTKEANPPSDFCSIGNSYFFPRSPFTSSQRGPKKSLMLSTTTPSNIPT
jgi:hypothetical protein